MTATGARRDQRPSTLTERLFVGGSLAAFVLLMACVAFALNMSV